MKALTALIALCFAFTATAQISLSEKQALIDLFHSTQGSEWNTFWDLEKPESTWYGVQIENNTVVGIELGFNNLQGELPASIGHLENLESLKLFFNQIGGTLPEGLFSLTKLKTLDLNSNMISGSLPATISKLENLEQLLISSNNFTGTLPSEIGNLNQLNTMVVFDNHFFGDFPYAISKLENLKDVVISNNNFNSQSLQTSVALLVSKGATVDFDELKSTTLNNTEFATIVMDDDN